MRIWMSSFQASQPRLSRSLPSVVADAILGATLMEERMVDDDDATTDELTEPSTASTQ